MTAVKYSAFAIFSTLVNLLFQYLSFWFYEGLGSLYVAMAFGTMAGLTTKYILDKKYIFYHKPKGRKDNAKKFFLYSAMGVITTMIFWGTEMVFYHLFPHPNAKYVGAIVGLTTGYAIKYVLDKRYVFIHKKGVAA